MTKTNIRQRLVVDHFYIPVSATEIEELSPLAKIFRDTPRRRVVSGKDHWEGIYIPSRTGAYFEIVHSKDFGGLGLGFSALRPQYSDVRKIARELPRLPWKKGRRLWENGKPWFDWLSLGGYSSEKARDVDAWIMHYHFTHRENFTPPSGPRTVDRFKSIQFTLGRKRVPEVRRLLSWLPGSQSWTRTKARLRLPDRESSAFDVLIDIRAGDAPMLFRRVELKLNDGQRIRDRRLGSFSLKRSTRESVILEKHYPQG